MSFRAETFKRVAADVKMDPKDVRGVSGHSVRVGATQGLLTLNIDLASVMQAGRWKSNRVPMRYGGGAAKEAQQASSALATPRFQDDRNIVGIDIEADW